MNNKQLRNSLMLIKWYYKFLYLGLFLDHTVRQHNISWLAKDVDVRTWPNTTFRLKKDTIQELLEEIHSNPDKENIFGYFTQLTMFRGISATMKELLDEENKFKKFLSNNLWKNFFGFEQIIKFVRNTLSHNIDTNIILKKQDFENQKQYLLKYQRHIVKFNFTYAKVFPKYRKWNKNYWVNIKINFKNISYWDKFFDIITLHNLFLLSELCYNMVEIYKAENNLNI